MLYPATEKHGEEAFRIAQVYGGCEAILERLQVFSQDGHYNLGMLNVFRSITGLYTEVNGATKAKGVSFTMQETGIQTIISPL